MRVGTQIMNDASHPNAIEDLVEKARAAQAAGLDDVWLGQIFDVDALTALAIIGERVKGIGLGVAVIPVFAHHPLAVAGQALTVQAATGNRLTLGIGLSHRPAVERVWGVPFERPVRYLRDYLSILMAVLHDGTVRYKGDVLSCRTIDPVRVDGADPPQVIVAALGPQTLKVAGELANGVVTWFVGPKTLKAHTVPLVSRSAVDAGRPSPRVVAGMQACVTHDRAGARARFTEEFGFYGQLPSYRAVIDREGVEGPVDIAVIGSEAEVADGLRRTLDAGADDLTVQAFGTPDERQETIELLGRLAG